MQKQQKNETPKKAWRKPVLKAHGTLVDLTAAKQAGGTDSGLGTPIS